MFRTLSLSQSLWPLSWETLGGPELMTIWKLGLGSADVHFPRENEGEVPRGAKGY